MKRIDFGKIGEHLEKTLRPPAHYKRRRSLRVTIVLAVLDAIITGFFLGAAYIDYMLRRGSWIWPLAMAFTFGMGTLRQTFVALHDCPRPPKTPAKEGGAAQRQGLAV